MSSSKAAISLLKRNALRLGGLVLLLGATGCVAQSGYQAAVEAWAATAEAETAREEESGAVPEPARAVDALAVIAAPERVAVVNVSSSAPVPVAEGEVEISAAAVVAQPAAQEDAARITFVVNQVEARDQQTAPFRPAAVDQRMPIGGQVQTGADSSARIDFADGSLIRIDENTLFTLDVVETRAGGLFARLQLSIGRLWVLVFGDSMEVETPVGVASVRGSFMMMEYQPSPPQATAACLDGTCQARFGDTVVDFVRGEQVVVSVDPVSGQLVFSIEPIPPALIDEFDRSPIPLGTCRPAQVVIVGTVVTFTPVGGFGQCSQP